MLIVLLDSNCKPRYSVTSTRWEGIELASLLVGRLVNSAAQGRWVGGYINGLDNQWEESG